MRARARQRTAVVDRSTQDHGTACCVITPVGMKTAASFLASSATPLQRLTPTAYLSRSDWDARSQIVVTPTTRLVSVALWSRFSATMVTCRWPMFRTESVAGVKPAAA